MLDSATLYAGLLVLRRTPAAEAFLEAWLELTMRGELATDQLAPGVAQDASFVEHRHDQVWVRVRVRVRRVR